MKPTYLLSALFMAAALAGCDQAKRSDTGTESSTNAPLREVKKEIKEAVEITKSYVSENKDEFVAATDRKLKELDQKIAELGDKVATLKDQAQAEGNKTLDALRETRAQLGTKLEELKVSSQDAWQNVKAGFESAMSELETAFANAKSKFDKE
jgi:hypothetical protein